MKHWPLRLAAVLAVLVTNIGVATATGVQQPPCSPWVNPLPPNYGAAHYAPRPCAAPVYAQYPQQPGPYQQQPGPYQQQPYQQQPYQQQPYQQQPYQQQPYQQQPYQQQQQYASSADSQSSSADDDDDDAYYSLFLDLLAVRVGTYDIRGSDADTRTIGFLVALDPDLTITADYLTTRSTFYAAIGGGSDGLEGQLTWRARAGVRGYVGEDHGPFLRIGYGLEFLGNNKLYRSWIDLPYGELGYQLLNEDVWFEFGATGGLVLGGRYYTGDAAERRIDTEPELGGQVTLQLDHFRAYASAMRIFAGQTGPGTPIDEATAELCLNPISIVLLCANAAFHRGDVELPGGGFSESTATYFGGTIGLGLVRTGGRGSL